MSEQPPSDDPREPEVEVAPTEAEAPAEVAGPVAEEPEVEVAPTEAEAPTEVAGPVAEEPEVEVAPTEAEAPAEVAGPVAEEPEEPEEPEVEASPIAAEALAAEPAVEPTSAEAVPPDADAPTAEEPADVSAPPEADAAGDAAEASKVELDPDERPAPPVRAQDPPATDPGAPGAVGSAAAGEAAADAEADAVAPAAGEDEGEELAPRVRPEIPGADLEPDIVLEGSESLTGEGAEDLAEADPVAPLGDVAEAHAEIEEQPIAQAAIDLAAGARYMATGKRKSAVARVIVKPGSGEYVVNGKPLAAYFPRPTLQRVIRQPLETVGYDARMDVVVKIHGGGVSAQAGALRHGISRALIEADPNLRTELKRRGFLTRDPRVKERKKAGLKKARKRPQFSKR